MSILRKIIHSAFLILLILGGLGLQPVFSAGTAIASLGNTKGVVEVIVTKDQKRVRGKDGVLLYVGDWVYTNNDGEATIFFRDGSEIRIFEKTELEIQDSGELQTKERSFHYNLFMKIGSLWGKFVTGRQKTKIVTSTATIGIKGTVMRVNDDGETARVSVAEGEISVGNETSSIILGAGKRLDSFGKTENLSDKVQDIPYRLAFSADEYQIDFNEGAEKTVRLNIQMQDVVNAKNIGRAGRVFFQSNYKNIKFPNYVSLNSKGFARFPVTIEPPHMDDNDFNGKIVIWAIMDGASYDNIGAGNLFMSVKVPNKRRQIRINADTGSIIPVE